MVFSHGLPHTIFITYNMLLCSIERDESSMIKKLTQVISCTLFFIVCSLLSAIDESVNSLHVGHTLTCYFVRHGQTDWNAGKVVPGVTDYSLNAVGEQQVNDLCNRLSTISFAACFASDLKRAQETAAILIKKQPHLTIVCDSRLRERDYGVLLGKEVIAEEEPAAIETIKKPETFAQRISSFLHDLLHTPCSGPVLVVSHAGCMRHMLSCMLQQLCDSAHQTKK